jgi:fructokinase
MRLGIDLGGTKTEGVILGDDDNVLFRERRPTPAADGYDAILSNIVDIVGHLEKQVGVHCSVGIGTPGSTDRATQLLKNSNTVCLNGQPVQADLVGLLGREVRLANDANCFALAEAQSGAGRGAGVVFGVILGTGVGGGVIMHGAVHAGPNDLAGEWGHNVLDPNGPDCYCGKRGCLETLCSGPGLAADHERVHGEKVTTQEIVARAAQGDPRAVDTMDRYVGRLGRALAVVVNIMDPDAIVLGGGLSAIERLPHDLPKAMAPYTFNAASGTRIVRNTLGDSAGVIGAAWLWSR